MKIDGRYEIRIVIIEQRNGTTGDVYDSLEQFRAEHPEHDEKGYGFGFVVFDTLTGYVPDACNDWNDTPEEALSDYMRNCQYDSCTQEGKEETPMGETPTRSDVITKKRTAREILSMIEEVYFGEEYKQYRYDKGSNGTRDLVIQKIKDTYGIG